MALQSLLGSTRNVFLLPLALYNELAWEVYFKIKAFRLEMIN